MSPIKIDKFNDNLFAVIMLFLQKNKKTHPGSGMG